MGWNDLDWTHCQLVRRVGHLRLKWTVRERAQQIAGWGCLRSIVIMMQTEKEQGIYVV
jgi:hypothetical protein